MNNSLLSVLASSLVAATLAACSSSVSSSPETTDLTSQAIPADSLLNIAEAHVGDTVVVRGFVRHTCKHSGRKCFISNADRTHKIRIMAGGEIGGFNKELIGSEIAVKGVVKKHIITKDQLTEINDTEETEPCESIDSQRVIMELNNNDQYIEYYLDGIDFEETQY